MVVVASLSDKGRIMVETTTTTMVVIGAWSRPTSYLDDVKITILLTSISHITTSRDLSRKRRTDFVGISRG